MNTLDGAIQAIIAAQQRSGKPLAVILAGHNGSGKSTMWYGRLANTLKIPLVNADRMMVSILPETMPEWARHLRDTDISWMQVAQKGVEAFVALAAQASVPFAMETVFSHWRKKPGGGFESKIDKLLELQEAGYFVLLLFVGLASASLSIGRVESRHAQGGHDVPADKLMDRFPRTQQAIKHAIPRADAAILMDNSRTPRLAFTICRVLLAGNSLYDYRRSSTKVPKTIRSWMEVVSPLT